MKTTHKTLLALALSASFGALAQVDQANTCAAESPGPCTNSNQHQGNTTSEVTGNVQAPVTSTQQGVASTSTTSGNKLDASNQSQVTQSPNSHITSTINPNTASSATGNRSENANNSAANVGDTTATSGPVTGTNTGKVDSTNVLGQQQGIQGSGNADVRNANSGTNSLKDSGNSAATGGQGGTGGSSGASAAGGNAQGGNASTGPINTGGNTLGTASGVERAGNSEVRVDASDRSSTQYSSRAVVWAPVVHTTAPALAAGALVVVPGACGPRVNIVRRDVVGQRFGVMGGQQEVMQGQDETTAPAANLFLVVEGFLVGHSVTTYTASVGTSSASSFSLGGFSNNGGGAQGGGSTGGQLQQLVQRVAVRECIYSSVQLAPEKNTAQAVAVPAQVLPVPARAAQTDRN